MREDDEGDRKNKASNEFVCLCFLLSYVAMGTCQHAALASSCSRSLTAVDCCCASPSNALACFLCVTLACISRRRRGPSS